METVTIGKKSYKVPKQVKEHIQCLNSEIELKKRLIWKIEELIDELEYSQREKINSIRNRLSDMR